MNKYFQKLSTDPGRFVQARDLVKQIAEFVNQNDRASAYVWDILTALRGPDGETLVVSRRNVDEALEAIMAFGKLKDATTAKIRYAIGLQQDSTNLMSVGTTLPEFKFDQFGNVMEPFPKADIHFVHHVMSAVAALKALGFYGKEHQDEPDAGSSNT